MEHPDSPRGTWVLVVAGLLVGGSLLAFLIALLGKWMIIALVVVGGVVLSGYLHYFLWGRALSQEVEAERAAEEAREALEQENLTIKEPPRPRRF